MPVPREDEMPKAIPEGMLVLTQVHGFTGSRSWLVIQRDGSVESGDRPHRYGKIPSERIAAIDALFRKQRVKSPHYDDRISAQDAPTTWFNYVAPNGKVVSVVDRYASDPAVRAFENKLYALADSITWQDLPAAKSATSDLPPGR